jgi:hypothetical protein
MLNEEISEFARLLVRHVRDESIRSCYAMLQPHAASPVAKRWKESGISSENLLRILPDAIDETIFNLLQAIDQGLLQVSYTSSNGSKVDLVDAGQGELSGWYMGSGGWRALFSEEPFTDDFSDLSG